MEAAAVAGIVIAVIALVAGSVAGLATAAVAGKQNLKAADK